MLKACAWGERPGCEFIEGCAAVRKFIIGFMLRCKVCSDRYGSRN